MQKTPPSAQTVIEVDLKQTFRLIDKALARVKGMEDADAEVGHKTRASATTEELRGIYFRLSRADWDDSWAG